MNDEVSDTTKMKNAQQLITIKNKRFTQLKNNIQL